MSARVKGFALLELLVTSGILLIVISALLCTFVNCAFLNESNNELIIAANDAQYVLEEIKGLAYGAIDSYIPPAFTHLRSESIPAPTVTQAGSRVKEVTVTVNWEDRKRRQRSLSFTTRIYGR